MISTTVSVQYKNWRQLKINKFGLWRGSKIIGKKIKPNYCITYVHLNSSWKELAKMW